MELSVQEKMEVLHGSVPPQQYMQKEEQEGLHQMEEVLLVVQVRQQAV
jgi:hypothetical protein